MFFGDTSLISPYRRERAKVKDFVQLVPIGHERLLALRGSPKGSYIYLPPSRMVVEFRGEVCLEQYAALYQLNCDASPPKSKRAEIVLANEAGGPYDHHWAFRFEQGPTILMRAIQLGIEAVILELPSGYTR